MPEWRGYDHNYECLDCDGLPDNHTEDCPYKQWRTEKPIHQLVVEVEYDGVVLQGRAIWGDPDSGVLPHWELANGVSVEPAAIARWRYL